MEWLRNAFTVQTPEEDWTPRHLAVADQVCQAVVDRKLETPALFLLEMGRPLSFLSSQLLTFFLPLAQSVINVDGPRLFAEFLERREAVDYLCDRIRASSESASESRELEPHADGRAAESTSSTSSQARTDHP